MAASTVVTGQHLAPNIAGLQRPSTELIWTRDIGSEAIAPRAASAVPPGRSYVSGSGGGAVGDPQGTRAFVAVRWQDNDVSGNGVFGYAIVAIDSISGHLIDTLDMPGDAQEPPHPALFLDAAHDRLFAVAAVDTADDVVLLSTNPLRVTSSWSVDCRQAAALRAVSRDGLRLYASCGRHILVLDPANGAVIATTTMADDVASLLLDEETSSLFATTIDQSVADVPAVVVFDSMSLVSRRSYATPAIPTALAVNSRGEVLFVALGGSGHHFFSLDPGTGTIVDRGDSGNVFYAPTTGRADRIFGVDTDLHCTSGEDCTGQQVVQYDALSFRVASVLVVDDRAPDDPSRDNFFAHIDFMAALPRTRLAVEYLHSALDHYFVTASPAEIALLDGGSFAGWQRTGQVFPVFEAANDTGDTTTPVCRYYGRLEKGIDSHFYSASPAECAAVAAQFGNYWTLETPQAFFVYPADMATGQCPSATVPVYRLYNTLANANHRYTTSAEIRAQMIAQGWVPEGYGAQAVAYCVPRS